MFSLQVPPEIVNEILKNVDKITLLSSRGVCVSWSRLCVNSLLNRITFRSWNDIRYFVNMVSSPSCTFPDSIKSKAVALNGLTAMDDEAISALQDLISDIALEESLALEVTTASIPDILAGVSHRWCNIRQLTLSGGSHLPAPFFRALTSFPRLGSLSLQDFRLEDVGQGAQALQFAFPAVLTSLSLVCSASLWAFFRRHVLPGHGLANLRELCVQERFCFAEEGVSDMMEGFREMDGIPTLRLRAIYKESAVSDLRDINRDLNNILQGPHLTLVKIRGLQRLHLDLSEVPAEVTLGSIIIHTIYLPSTHIGVSVEFEVPRSLNLWENADPSGQIRQLLQETQHNATAIVTASLAVRGFPGSLPAAVQASGSATVCGYPVVFISPNDEQ